MAVGFDVTRESVGAHGEILIDFDKAQIFDADARDHRGLLQRGMRLSRGVGDEVSIASFLIADVVGGAFAGCEHSAESGARRSVLNDSTAGARG